MALLEMLSTITGLIEAFAGLYILYLALYRFWTVPWSGKELRETTGAPHLGGAIGQAAWGWAGDLAKRIPGAGDALTKYFEQEVRTLPQRKMEVLNALNAIKAQVETATRFDKTITQKPDSWSFKKISGITADKFQNKIEKDVINVGVNAANIATIKIDEIKNSFSLLENEAKELSAFNTKDAKEIAKQILKIVAEKNIQYKLQNYVNILNGLLKRAKEIYDTTQINNDAGSTLMGEYKQQAGSRTGIIPDLEKFDTILGNVITAIVQFS